MAKTDELTYAYAEIVKTEKNADGDVFVFGKAAGPEIDLDGQIADPAWLKSAMPDWMKWGNVRAMHGPVAAGIGVDLQDSNGDGWTLKSLVVDQDSKEKVEKKVYKGYSIGIKNARVVRDSKAPKGRIVGGDIVEISLVDRPANPTTTMMLCKVAGFGSGLLPVDEEGHMLKVAEPDLIKSARATVQAVLHDDLVVQLDEAGDIAAAKQRINEVCDLLIHEATVLKNAAADEVVDISGMQDAVAALGEFGDTSDGDYDGIEDDAAAYAAQMEAAATDAVEKALTRTLGAEYAKMLTPDLAKALGVRPADAGGGTADAVPATLLEAEITKAVAKATAPLEEQLKAAQADLAKAMAAARPGGPVLITQPTAPTLTKSAEADRYLAIADRTSDPALALAYKAAAAKAGEVAV